MRLTPSRIRVARLSTPRAASWARRMVSSASTSLADKDSVVDAAATVVVVVPAEDD